MVRLRLSLPPFPPFYLPILLPSFSFLTFLQKNLMHLYPVSVMFPCATPFYFLCHTLLPPSPPILPPTPFYFFLSLPIPLSPLLFRVTPPLISPTPPNHSYFTLSYSFLLSLAACHSSLSSHFHLFLSPPRQCSPRIHLSLII